MSINLHRFIFSLLFLTLVMGCHPKKEKEVSPLPQTPAPASALQKPEATAIPVPLPTATSSLEAAQLFFNSVSDEKYDLAWTNLTTKSKDKIVSMVVEDEKMDPKEVRELFEQNKVAIQNGFWKSFRASSKIGEIAPTAAYRVIRETGNEAVIEVSSGRIKLELKIYKEGPQWKMGYVETFLD